ncbi:FK506-binding protein 2 [Syncephalis plumigaleata]|nr:FK506-binding protein 2 [Syncephalis plumigaleata]
MQLTKLVTLLAVAGAMIPAVAMAKKKKEAPTELRIGIMKKISDEDCLQKAKKGDVLKMHYTGKLFDDDTVFDSSITRGVPFEFTLGMGQVIKGWDQGIVGMCIGEKRKLVFPAEYGYGSLGSPPTIPGK